MEKYTFGASMQNFDDLDIEGRNPSYLSEEERVKDEHDRKRLMRCSVTAEDGTLRPVYSETDDGDIWCHICNVALFGAHKLISHNTCNRHKIKLDEWPYPVMLWSKKTDSGKLTAPSQAATISSALAPGEPIPPGMEDQITRTTTIQVSLDRHRSSPLVGLEYLLELVDSDSCEPSYTCVLCDKRGDPRTVMAHITSYNHRITYLNRHFPTISRAILDLPRTPNYKRGANEISVLVAKKIEEKFGRLQPQLVDKNQFEKNKIQYIKRVYQDFHFRETPELTFMEVYDVRWVTNFEEKMAETTVSNVKKEHSSTVEQIDDKYNKEDKKTEKMSYKKVEPRSQEMNKPGIKIRMFIKDKSNLKKSEEKVDETLKPSSSCLSSETKSLSSLSSISSSPSPSRSRSRSPERHRKMLQSDRDRKYYGRSKYSRDRVRSRSHSRSRSRSLEPIKERDKWEKYREQIKRAEEGLDRALKFHEKNPEKHPSYPDEWKKFWNRRYKELQAEGKDPSKHDFKPEWIDFWNKRMREIHSEQLAQKKEEIKKRLDLPEDKPPEKWIPPPKREKEKSPKRKRFVDSDEDVEYVGTKTKSDYYDRHDLRDREYSYSSYGRGKSGLYRGFYPRGAMRTRPTPYPPHYVVTEKPPSPPFKEEVLNEDLEIVGLLRLLTALENQLGSLGPKVVSLLSKALAAEKAKPNSAEELLYDEEVNVLFETVKEKLKGQLFAGMIEKVAINPTKSAIQNIAQLLHKSTENKKKIEEENKKKREFLTMAKVSSFVNTPIISKAVESTVTTAPFEPVSVPGIGTIDKVAIAQQIAAALVAQGRTNVSQEELETLINAVVGMAEASKNSDKPVTTADFVKGLAANNKNNVTSVTQPVPQPQPQPPPLTPNIPMTSLSVGSDKNMENLTDDDLKNLLQNFKDLGTQEQHNLISFLKKLEATDPARVEKLRAYVNLETPTSSISHVKSNVVVPETEIVIKTRKSISPFSVRKEIQNPPGDEERWKPKLDIFAEDEDEMKCANESRRTKIELSDDDEDYTFEDIYKAANKNVSESEKASGKHGSDRKSNSNTPKSWSRSRSRSPSFSGSLHLKHKESTKSSDSNTILNETKRLIANLMGDLPNKYVPKSRSTNEIPSPLVNNQRPPDLTNLPNPMPEPTNFMNYNSNYGMQSNTPQMGLQQPMAFPKAGNPPRLSYPQEQPFNSNVGFMDNSYNYQGYSNVNNSNPYNMPPVNPQNQYGLQPNYSQPHFNPSGNGYPQSQHPPQDQFGTYTHRHHFY